MIKRICALLCVLLTLIVTSPGISLAGGLKVIDVYPREGSSNSYPINLGIKLYFSGDVATPELRGKNEQCFTLVGEEGPVPVKILFADADPTYILVLTEPDDKLYGLGSSKEFTLTISEELSAVGGATLDAPYSLTFKTRNTSGDMTVSMTLMGGMFVAMLVFTMISAKRKAQKQTEKTVEKVNPYKKSKETGRSVSQIIAEEERKKKRQEARSVTVKAPVKKAASTPKPKGRDRIMRVSRPHPISETGSSYVSGRKEAAEKRARELEEQLKKGTTRPKNIKTGKKKKK